MTLATPRPKPPTIGAIGASAKILPGERGDAPGKGGDRGSGVRERSDVVTCSKEEGGEGGSGLPALTKSVFLVAILVRREVKYTTPATHLFDMSSSVLSNLIYKHSFWAVFGSIHFFHSLFSCM
jgi:hypothetical protein